VQDSYEGNAFMQCSQDVLVEPVQVLNFLREEWLERSQPLNYLEDALGQSSLSTSKLAAEMKTVRGLESG
jgi:hypothetical protein